MNAEKSYKKPGDTGPALKEPTVPSGGWVWNLVIQDQYEIKPCLKSAGEDYRVKPTV